MDQWFLTLMLDDDSVIRPELTVAEFFGRGDRRTLRSNSSYASAMVWTIRNSMGN